jgi:hypothetical protein
MLTILAYFDPGSGSFLVQVIVGGSAGLVVLGKYLWNSLIDRRGNAGLPGIDSKRKLIANASSAEISIIPD